ncbi:ATPase, histidine kinase-, DNA gyrase B (macronuclear) [Tetrahymena thermophila SB210]|uniref:histidine kinase n=1 Tax=Tetrahymena thermophila (strain SB210) TaxID=312017 RepID=Q22W45_TETTS|nr:ATPase, histidine kinase-, DNA gyrase B [Tetrahymena thermophila SB210]EAR89572.2 ATPase, histidine kinase-, DNA gyrase B [Tetrahymena thermophila SB210]|eukprot:XP_001009817.2 ATPase, histidine kinase-, DNA gyrase B [Tetrahymena thermophila SB210]
MFLVSEICFCILFILFFEYRSCSLNEKINNQQNQSQQMMKQQDSHTINLEDTIKIQDFSGYPMAQNDQSLAKSGIEFKPLVKNTLLLTKKLDISGSQNHGICQSIEMNEQLIQQEQIHSRSFGQKNFQKRNLTFFQRQKRNSQRNLTTLLLKQSVKTSLEKDILNFLFAGVLMIDYKKKIIYQNDQIEQLIQNCKSQQIFEIILGLNLSNQDNKAQKNSNNNNNKHIDFSRSQLDEYQNEECAKLDDQNQQFKNFLETFNQRIKNQQSFQKKINTKSIGGSNTRQQPQSMIRSRNTSLLENITNTKQNKSSSESFDSELQDIYDSSKIQSSENGAFSKNNFFEEDQNKKLFQNKLKKQPSSGLSNYGKLVKNGNISECKILLEALNRQDSTLQTIIDILLEKNYWKDFWKRHVIHTDTDICANNESDQKRDPQLEQKQNYILQGNSISFQINMKTDKKSKERPFYLKLSSFLTQKAYQQKGLNRQKIKMVLLIEIIPLKNILTSLQESELNNFKNKVISSLSHELRTPLNCSIQMLELLLHSENQSVSTKTLVSQHNFQISDEVKKMFIYPALNSSYLLLSMINDIIDFAQINSGKLRLYFSSFNIRDLIKDCVQLFTLQATIKNLEILVNIDPLIPQLVHSDQNRIKQVLLALLSNAIKFTDKGFVSITAENYQQDLIRISVEDTGNGITPEVKSQLFKGFQNSNSIKSSSRQSKMSHNLGKNRSLSIQTIKANLMQNASLTMKKSQQFTNQRSSQNYRSSIFGEENIEISENITRKEVNTIFAKLNSMSFGEAEEQNNTNINKSSCLSQNAGIGLTIANHLAQGLGGNRSIIVESEINKGSSFRFFFINQPSKSKGIKQNQGHAFEKSYQAWKTIQSEQNQTHSLQSLQSNQNPNSFLARQNETINLEQTANILEQQQQQGFQLIYQDQNQVQEEEEDELDEENEEENETDVKEYEEIAGYNCNYKNEDHRDLISNSIHSDSCNVIIDKSEQRIPQNPQTMQIEVAYKKFEEPFYDDHFVTNEAKNNQNKDRNSAQQDIKNQIKYDENIYSINDLKRYSNFNRQGSGYDQEIINIQESLRNFLKTSFAIQNVYCNVAQNQSMNQINSNSICKINMNDLGSGVIPPSPQFNQMHKKQSHKKQKRNSYTISMVPTDQNQKKDNAKSIQSQNNLSNKDSQISVAIISEGSYQQIQKPQETANEQIVSLVSLSHQKYFTPENKNIQLSPKGENKKIIVSQEQEFSGKQKQCSCNQILIVDDNDFNLISLEMRLLRQYHLKVDKANSGFVAINLVQKKLTNLECCQTYKLIFMDIDMPVKNGHQTTKEILSLFSSQIVKPPIISACTAYSQDAERKKAQQSGMKFYITKPIDVQQLENVLRQVQLIQSNNKNTQQQ